MTGVAMNRKNLTISIVTPSYNQAEYLERTIQSVLSQEEPFEYWVMDGGSTDGSQAILERYAGRMQWESEADRGQAHAINKGWQRCTGDILAWLNADDIYLPGCFNVVREYFANHPEVDMLYGECLFIDEKGNVIGRYPSKSWNFMEFIKKSINYIPQPSVFIRRSVVESVGWLDENLHYCMDMDYWLRIGIHHRVDYIQTPLAAMRLHPRTKTNTAALKMAEEHFKVFQRFFEQADLPSTVRALKPVALANAAYQAASYCIRARSPRRAFEYIRLSRRYHFRLFIWHFIKVCLLSLRSSGNSS